MNVLQVENLRKLYSSRLGGIQSTALDGVNFEVREGEFVGIMGPSGAGKTTLLNIIATVDSPTSGRVVVGGQEISLFKDVELAKFRRERLGFLFQDFNLLDTLTLKENAILPLALAKVPVHIIEEKVIRLANQLGITNILDKYPYEVSGGQKQRAAAIRAFINEPQLVLADEPTGALDSKSARELLQCLTDLNGYNRATILMVTHDAFAASYCQRIIFIKDGTTFTEIIKGSNRKDFFDRILDVMAALGGDQNELL